jgi:hypothetical protein
MDPLFSFRQFRLNESLEDLSKKYNFHPVPDGNNNYRSAQMPLDVFPNVCKENGITTVLRLNFGGRDGRHTEDQKEVTIEGEKKICEENGILFLKMKSDDPLDQEIMNKFLKKGNCLVHCAHGADRTGGAIGGYLFIEHPADDLTTTDQIWKYTTKYNNWNKILNDNPKDFNEDYYLAQAQKFGVKDLDHAIKLAQKYAKDQVISNIRGIKKRQIFRQ